MKNKDINKYMNTDLFKDFFNENKMRTVMYIFIQ